MIHHMNVKTINTILQVDQNFMSYNFNFANYNL